MVFDIVDPLLYTFEGVPVGDIVDDDSYGGVPDIVGNQSFEPLLASRVPQLQSDGLVFQEYILRDEVDPDRWPLHRSMSTCSLPSKMS